MQGAGYRVQGTGYRVQGTGYRIQGTPRWLLFRKERFWCVHLRSGLPRDLRSTLGRKSVNLAKGTPLGPNGIAYRRILWFNIEWLFMKCQCYPLCGLAVRGRQYLSQNRIKSSLTSLLICATGRRIPASSSANQGN